MYVIIDDDALVIRIRRYRKLPLFRNLLYCVVQTVHCRANIKYIDPEFEHLDRCVSFAYWRLYSFVVSKVLTYPLMASSKTRYGYLHDIQLRPKATYICGIA